ncbi:MAG: threonylcarbamoyl-AMP synthase [Bifidobacteriaceae bacterium]|nr:threonylcarbamoyl-AMP synthase [Bifidobacteriaceae bacterium]
MNLRDCRGDERAEAIAQAVRALDRGELVVLPTDTVYGVGAKPGDAAAVAALLQVKGRSRAQPPPVLVASTQQALELADAVTPAARQLARHFWPGGLTLVLQAMPDLGWDLGDRPGTVALRVPDHPVASELLRAAGPLAVSSANRSGLPPALSAQAAAEYLGGSVAVYLDAGTAPGGTASTVVDATGPVPRILRTGAITANALAECLGGALGAALLAAAVDAPAPPAHGSPDEPPAPPTRPDTLVVGA